MKDSMESKCGLGSISTPQRFTKVTHTIWILSKINCIDDRKTFVGPFTLLVVSCTWNGLNFNNSFFCFTAVITKLIVSGFLQSSVQMQADWSWNLISNFCFAAFDLLCNYEQLLKDHLKYSHLFMHTLKHPSYAAFWVMSRAALCWGCVKTRSCYMQQILNWGCIFLVLSEFVL